MKSMKNRIKSIAGGKGILGNAARRIRAVKIKSIFLAKDGSWNWFSRILLQCAAFTVAAPIALYLSDDIIKTLLSHHRGIPVTSVNYKEIIKEYQVLLSAAFLGLFGLVFSQGNWVIRNHDVQKGTRDKFNEQRELLYSSAVRALLDRSAAGGNAMNAHGLRELARLAHQGAVEKERIDAVTGAGHDLREANLKGAKLAGLDLQSVQLSGAILTRADLSGANLLYAKLTEANLSRAKLISARLTEADLSKAGLVEANLTKVNLIDAKLNEADLSGADLFMANLHGADLRGANMSGAKLPDVRLTGADLRGTNLTGVNLSRIDLSGANLSGNDLGGTDFLGTKLAGVDLSETKLAGGNFLTADLNGANLSGADLSKTVFQNTNLTKADLSKADLRGADLEGADLSEANLQGVIYDENTKFPKGFGPESADENS